MMLHFIFKLHSIYLYLHSFPTRRSSDLYLATIAADIVNASLMTDVTTPCWLWESSKGGRYGGQAWSASRTSDRKSTRLNSSHVAISYAVFCLKKKMSEIKPKN